jgi:hypothetical protein
MYEWTSELEQMNWVLIEIAMYKYTSELRADELGIYYTKMCFKILQNFLGRKSVFLPINLH